MKKSSSSIEVSDKAETENVRLVIDKSVKPTKPINIEVEELNLKKH